MSTQLTQRKRKITAEVPAVLRGALASRAANLNLPLITVVAAALRWFVDHDDEDQLPVLLVDPKNLPTVATTHPRTFSMELHSELIDSLDEIVATGRHGSDRSEVIRTALCFYISACGTMHRTPLVVPSHLMNT
jgi:hypothetical protein